MGILHITVLSKDISSQHRTNWNEPVSTAVTQAISESRPSDLFN